MAVPSVEDVKDYDRNELPTADDPHYTSALAAAIQWMNDECQRNFVVAGTATLRTFVPNACSDYLYIGDCTGATSVVENGVTLTVGVDYQLEPVTNVDYAGMTLPYTSLRRLDANWYTYNKRGTVAVIAPWGWTAIPVRVAEAIKILTSDIVKNRGVSLGLVGFDDTFTGISPRMNPIVRAAIDGYRGPKSWGIG